MQTVQIMRVVTIVHATLALMGMEPTAGMSMNAKVIHAIMIQIAEMKLDPFLVNVEEDIQGMVFNYY